MLKLGSHRKGIGTPVVCPACRYPNLGIYIWCERCGAPLDWHPPSPGPVSNPPVVPSVVPAALAEPEPVPTVPQTPAFTLPRLSMPAITWPQLKAPALTVPRPNVPRVIGTVSVVAAILVVLLFVAVRLGASGRLPPTNGPPAGDTALAAAIPGVEAKTALHYHTGSCATKDPCLTVAGQTVGEDAAAVVFSTAATAGRQCVGYVFRSGGRWHFVDAVCGLPDELSPLVGHDAIVHVPANCANVRTGASLKAHVVACLNDGNAIHIDGGPAYADGRLWWHEQQGWIAHDFLTGP